MKELGPIGGHVPGTPPPLDPPMLSDQIIGLLLSFTIENGPSRGRICTGDCGRYIPLSDDKHQMVQENSKKRTGCLRKLASADVIVTQLLRYHMPLLYTFRMQPFNLDGA